MRDANVRQKCMPWGTDMRVCFAASVARRRDWYRLWGAIADGKLGKGNNVADADEWHEV